MEKRKTGKKKPATKRKRASKKPAAKRKKAVKKKPASTETSKVFEVELQVRHAQWVFDAAEFYQTTPQHIIEQAVRQSYQADRTVRVSGASGRAVEGAVNIAGREGRLPNQ